MLPSFSQESEKKKFSIWEYTNSNTTFNINSNHDGRFSNEGESRIQKGLSLEINSIYGIFLFQYVSISGGLGVDFNLNRTYWALPFIGDFRVYTKPYGEDGSLYGFLQFGKNIEIKDVFRDGRLVKIGAGIVIDDSVISDYIVELYAKYKETHFDGNSQLYNISSVGFSVGYKF